MEVRTTMPSRARAVPGSAMLVVLAALVAIAASPAGALTTAAAGDVGALTCTASLVKVVDTLDVAGKVSWTAPTTGPSPTEYQIGYRRLAPGTTWAQVAWTPGAMVAQSPTTKPGVAYEMRVRGRTPGRSGPWCKANARGPVRQVGTAAGDNIDGTNAPDAIAGLGAADTLRGFDGADRLTGAGGHDSLLGGDGADVLLGGPGIDRLTGGRGIDTLDGGDGNDIFGAVDGRSDLVRCGPGYDRVFADADDRVRSDCESVQRAEARVVVIVT